MDQLPAQGFDAAGAPREDTPVRVLLVDDTPQNLLALEAILGDLQLTLVQARSGEEALRQVLKEDFAAILLDVLMPGMDGLETAALLRARDRSRATPIIFVTAAGRDEELPARAYGLGAVDYIVKPIQPAILRSKVMVFVDLYRKSARIARQAVELARLNAELEERVAARTQQLQAAQAAAEQERDRLRQVLDVLPDGVLITDAAGEVLSSNRAASEIIGLDLTGRRWLEATSALEIEVRNEDGTPVAAGDRPVRRSLVEGAIVHGVQMRIHGVAAGRDVPILISSAPLRDAAGTIFGAVAAFQDISPLKRAEQQRDEFMASVSHDIRNPLTAIIGTAQVLQRRATRPDGLETARLLAGLETINSTATQIANLLTSLLDLNHLRMGRPLNLNPRPTDLVALTTRVAATYAHATERHTVRVEHTVSTLDVLCDPLRVERVLGNLLSNALKYSPEQSEITVTLGHADEDAAWAVLQVRDQGVGISEEDLPHVFERYFRGSAITARVQGTGLGLASVRQIVEQHGGMATVSRNDGAGVTFTVRLPVAGPAPAGTPGA